MSNEWPLTRGGVKNTNRPWSCDPANQGEKAMRVEACSSFPRCLPLVCDDFLASHHSPLAHCTLPLASRLVQHNKDILEKLVLKDGSVLRAQTNALPTLQCLLRDPQLPGEGLLQVWALNPLPGEPHRPSTDNLARSSQITGPSKHDVDLVLRSHSSG